MRILIAEDEPDMNALIARKLGMEGYAVDSCPDGLQALEYIRSMDYDAIILDIMMPGMDGLEVLRTMRGLGIGTPVLFLTARDAVDDRVTGLDMGANDYIVKPFSFKELMARLRVLTREQSGEITNTYTVGDLTVDTAAHVVLRGGKEVKLSAREYAILEYLISNKGIVLSRERIEAHVWNYEYAVSSNAVDVHIRHLREKIDKGSGAKLIHTVRGTGYILREPD